jgi:uridine kinase
MDYDVFISHASEDKQQVAQPLAQALSDHGVRVWLDAHVLMAGDSLRRSIDRGLGSSKYGIVVLSPRYFEKEWSLKELDALVSKETGSGKVILPVLHDMTHAEACRLAPLLADKVALTTRSGIDVVARQIVDAVKGDFPWQPQRATRRTVIGISGASCSGKSWLAHKLKQARPASVVLFDLDSYYKDDQFVSTLEHKYDNPKAINFEDALVDLIKLKSGHEVTMPFYNYDAHRVEGEKLCKSGPLIVVEGIFALANRRLRKELDIKVWVDSGEDLRYERRMRRDTIERGRDVQDVLARYASDVKPGYQKYIRPLRIEADVIFENNGRDLLQRPMIVEMLLSYVDKIALFE